ncbi:glycosyltransferase [Olivibacter domesticus]|uniref:Glycosyltransferase involved in cell wall bisynthesis n=1 Tax=Olivibacter domesticus TaxID=407022 RepID=A0A1H7UXF8_OLID1|nr:glycosyltransferase [Olivibacter domesticus]SEM01345.1 Glycosyltransferase involved in cell wall bisynthesis [Olivibacter domesticus]
MPKMIKDNVLICFTASFPYGNKETFFENELPYLSVAFERVIIYPLYNPTSNESKRKVPINVDVYPTFVSKNKAIRVFSGIFNFSPVSYYIKDLFEQKVYLSVFNIKKWFNSLLSFRTSYATLKERLKKIDKKCMLYSYWAEAPLFVTSLCKQKVKVIRMHRSDFYLEVNNNYLPLRQQIYDSSDLLLPISRDIAETLKSHYNINERKIFLNYLGVDNNKGPQIYNYDSSLIRIVSCSRVDPIKRVDLIAEALLKYQGSKKIEWHHFGDGMLFEALKKKVKETLRENVQIYLHGWSTQEQIYNFYETNEVTWFINVSLHEGVPVSIMEALSFGIPVIATNVGGTAESVNETNGFIVPVTINSEELLNKILEIEDRSYLERRNQAFITWKSQFVAKTNYDNLVEKLKSL